MLLADIHVMTNKISPAEKFDFFNALFEAVDIVQNFPVARDASIRGKALDEYWMRAVERLEGLLASDPELAGTALSLLPRAGQDELARKLTAIAAYLDDIHRSQPAGLAGSYRMRTSKLKSAIAAYRATVPALTLEYG